MKKVFILLVSLFAMTAAGTGLKAQEVSIMLHPEWNWIGYPFPESVDLGTAFGGFEPLPGDVIESYYDYSEYVEGYGWFGGVDELHPGWGYMYYSSRTEAVNVMLHTPASQTAVTTAEPTGITATSAVVGGTVTVPEGTHVFLRGVCWGIEPDPDIDGDHTSEETGVGAFSSTLEGLTTGLTYYVRAYAVTDYGLVYGENMSFVSNTSYEYVDLGLPSGLLWATCNVGANAPEDYGDYFAWGETQPKEIYNWNTYQYYMGDWFNRLIKYCNNSSYGYNGFADNLTILLPEDDAATANWGSDWRMPTKEEWQELYNNTTVTWTQQNGVNGRLFTASNGNSLFLPAAGGRNGSNLSGAGSHGYYWSSSLNTNDIVSALEFSFFSGNYTMYGINEREDGKSVRAVRSSGQTSSFIIINAFASPSDGGTVFCNGNYLEGQICTVAATANAGYIFANWTENGEVVSTEENYSFAMEADRVLVANFVVPDIDGNGYVDLGLPSGLLWATRNVGADNSEDYGDYFAWGETQSKDSYDWSTYQYCNGSYNTMTKYCTNSSYGYNGFTDNLTTLLPEDDAATTNWGSNGWRMPTKEEWQELYNNTTCTRWTTQNGVNGWLFTATNGNKLFIPAAGFRGDGELIDDGSYGYYWSSSLYPGESCSAWYFCFESYMRGTSRCAGFAVRPVIGSGHIINVTASPSEGGIVAGGGFYQEWQSCTVTATANTGYYFSYWTENGEVVSTDATYSFFVDTDKDLVANFAVSSGDDHAYVDLGLPSGTLWATCNVGANTPVDSGDYFAWGETQPKDTYDWSTYQYCNGNENTLTKYCTNADYGYNGFTDNLTILLPEDDAATANWGSDWRMPTKEEWQELCNNTTVTWTQQNGMKGRLFTASNGNSLFLPVTGYRYNSSLYNAGYSGYYWSSSLNTGYPSRAWYFYFGSGGYNVLDNSRHYGRSVRPVRSASQN